MNKLGVPIVAGMLLAAVPAFPQGGSQTGSQAGQGRAVITVLPANESDLKVDVSLQNLKLKINGKESDVTGWTRLSAPASPVEMVLLIDGGARSSLGTQFGEMQSFIKEMPTETKLALAYMENGRAVLMGPLTSDSAELLRELHLPAAPAGSSGSPYFCLSDLAQHWPSTDHAARRVVVMITDGLDPYQRGYDPADPYVQTAIRDSVRSGLVVYSMYWHVLGRADSSAFGANAGQSLLNEVTEATGGQTYSEGNGNPVSFEPFFTDIRRCLRNQYELNFSAHPGKKPEVETLKLQLEGIKAKVHAPEQVLVE
jgi:hypothetical protein